jgi:hypothetical protein
MEACKKMIGRYFHFWQLSKKCYFWLKQDFWNKVELIKKENFKSWGEFSNKLTIPSGALVSYYAQKTRSTKAQFIPLERLIKISELCKIHLQETENYIIFSKYGLNGGTLKMQFPIDFLKPEMAGLIGALLSEGHMSEDLDLTFWNKDKEVINKFILLLEHISPKAYSLLERNNAYRCFMPAIIADILIRGLNFHKGNKIVVNPGIPDFYMQLDISNIEYKQAVCSLLSWLFTGDGWISLFKDHLGQTHRHMGIGFSVLANDKPPKLLSDTRILIKKLGINPQVIHKDLKIKYYRKNKEYITESWKFFIHGKENFELFDKLISFQDSRRQKILQESIKSFLKPKLRNGESLFRIINSVMINKICDKYRVSQDSKLSIERVGALLKYARNKGLIFLAGLGRTPKTYRRKVFLYSSTQKGIDFIKCEGVRFT